MSSSISELRKEYSLKKLTKEEVNANPVLQFEKWFLEAKASISGEPNAMILSTASSHGRPSSRLVLLKGFSKEGFVFFTNYGSHKGHDLETNPFAALLFFWEELERQIRIEGWVEKLSQEESSEYFATRPRLSQIGALASTQSEPVESRTVLEKRFQHIEKLYEGKEIPRPKNWGGYIVKPEYFEFWQGRQSRLHDRISYRTESGKWLIERLSP
jgi:pyridoxamine 5'-phosphate oxidase